jgi:predicted CoA-binding protein
MSKKTIPQLIKEYLEEGPYAVVGASTNRDKYGNKVLRAYLQNGREAFPINPRAEEIEGLKAYPDLASLPVVPRGISVITPPKITESVVVEAARLGVKYVWMQPGAQSEEAIRKGEEAGLGIIGDGSCALVVMGFHEEE